MATNGKPTILLVHGAWHGSWCWDHQVPELEALGYATATVDMPCTSGAPGSTQEDDVASVRAAIEALLAAGKRVVVLAHSYAGPIANSAVRGLSERQRGRPGVVGLIHLCAFIFPTGLNQGAAVKAAGDLPYVKWDSPSEGLFVPREPLKLFYPPDVPDELAHWAAAKLEPQSMAANLGIVPPQAWQNDADNYRGRFAYVKCDADAIVPLAQQEAMLEGTGDAQNWVLRTLHGSGHSPFLSRPKELAGVIDGIIDELDKH